MILKRTAMILLACFPLLLTAATGTRAAESPSVLVRTESLKKAPLPSTLTCYGEVNADTRRTVNIGFPRAGAVSRLMVSAGEVVNKGRALLVFRTAPGDALEYRKAQAALNYARDELRRTETLAAKHLATNAQVASARKDLAEAEALLQTQRKLGQSLETERVLAPFDGVVTALNVKEGDRTQAGTTFLQLARKGALRADLGVEPEDVHRVAVGMPVSIDSVFDAGQKAKGRVTEVHGIINPQTRLVDVLVGMSSGISPTSCRACRFSGKSPFAPAPTGSFPIRGSHRPAGGLHLPGRRRQGAPGQRPHRGADRQTDGHLGRLRPPPQGRRGGQLRAEGRHGRAGREAMKFTDWSQPHRRSLLFLLVMLAAAGLMAAFQLPVTLFPKVDFPRVDVTLDAGDRPADQMVLQVTRPVEEAVRRVPGVRGVRSTTSRGSADISIYLRLGHRHGDGDPAGQRRHQPDPAALPPGTTLHHPAHGPDGLSRSSPTASPPKTLSLTALHDLAHYQLRPLLSSVDGVARVGVVGGAREEYRVTVDPARLQAYRTGP